MFCRCQTELYEEAKEMSYLLSGSGKNLGVSYLEVKFEEKKFTVFRVRIRIDPHFFSQPGSRIHIQYADPDPA